MDNALTSVKGTAFGLGEAATIAASAVAAGIKPGEKLAKHLTNVANNAAAAGISMEEMGGVFNKAATQANGVQNDVISQLADRGIPIYQALADQMGVTAGEVFKLASEGKVNFETFSAAAEKAAGTVSAEMGGTVTGSWKNMWASIGRVGANALSGVFPQIAPALQGVMNALGPVEEKAKVVGEAVGKWLSRGAEAVKTFIAEWKSGEGLGGRAAEMFTRITDGAKGLFDLLVRGDYSGALRNAFGWEEDSGAVDALFRLRDAVIDLGGWIKDTLLPAARDFGGWLKDHKGVVIGVAAAYGALKLAVIAHTAAMAAQKAGGFGAMLMTWVKSLNFVQTATKMAAAVQWLWNAAITANPIGIIIVAVTALVGALVWFFTKTETGQRIVTAAWEGIKTVVSAVVGWFTGTALPFMKGVWDGIAAGASRLWGVLSPVFSAIGVAFKTVGGFIWSVWSSVIKLAWDLIAFGAKALWNNVLKPVFGYIKAGWDVLAQGVRWAWTNLLKPAWDAVSAGASWLWKSALKPAFDGIKAGWDFAIQGIKWAWDNILKPVFNAVSSFVTDTVVPGVQRGVDTLKSIWTTVANLFRSPINWVINTVWNNGLKKAFDNVATAIGSSSRLPQAPTIPAFAKGGYHKGGWALVGEEGPELINTSNPARVYTAAQTAAMLGAGEGSEGGSVGSVVRAAVDWIRGGLASAAGAILDPLKRLISSSVGQWGTSGRLAGDVAGSAIDRLVSWIRGKDAEAPTIGGSGWARPANGPVSQRFGVAGVLSGLPHAGIDIATTGKTFAAAAGQVLKTGMNILGGRSGIGILLQHAQDLFTYYGHNPVGGVQVKPGQSVKAGQHIGFGGSTGNVTGPHLHFELHKGGIGRAVDPAQLGVFDNGGFLQPGALGTNFTGKPEPVLTSQQWADIHRLAVDRRSRPDGPQRIEGTLDLGNGLKGYVRGTIQETLRGAGR